MTNILLVPVADLKAKLRIDFTDDDDILESYLLSASMAVIRHIKGNASEYLTIDSPPNSPPNGLDDVPADIQQATLMLAMIWYRSPDHDTDGAFADGSLPPPVMALLRPYRDPTMA